MSDKATEAEDSTADQDQVELPIKGKFSYAELGLIDPARTRRSQSRELSDQRPFRPRHRRNRIRNHSY